MANESRSGNGLHRPASARSRLQLHGFVFVAATTAALWILTRGESLATSLLVVVAMALCVLAGLLLWPGPRSTYSTPTLGIVGWSAACVTTALVQAAALGVPRVVIAPLLAAGLLAFLLLLAAIACTQFVASLLRRNPDDEHSALEAGRWLVLAALLLAALAPLWAGPFAEVSLRRWPGAVDAVIAVSPLAHLAVAAGNDLLRNEWMYAHSNLGSLQFNYPTLTSILAGYAIAAIALLFVQLLIRNRRHSAGDGTGAVMEPAR